MELEMETVALHQEALVRVAALVLAAPTVLVFGYAMT
jgi:hypothetical protein